MHEEIEHTFNEKLLALDPNVPTFEARKYSINIERAENLEALESMSEYKKKKKKRKFFDIDQKIKNSIKSKTTKILIDFNCLDSASIQSFAVKKNNNVKLTTRFLSGKMLMFVKLSLMSFIYELVETFYFPDETVKKIYEKYLIEKVYIYHVLTDTDMFKIYFCQ